VAILAFGFVFVYARFSATFDPTRNVIRTGWIPSTISMVQRQCTQKVGAEAAPLVHATRFGVLPKITVAAGSGPVARSS
jgi:hypothetical protein